ncbi:MAG: hypothetical protein A2289_03840 [Deltaproteobacteria bacterium RIFOXYA12_FULL_58_15]|nr:MAG: hypothetical protein A2289_03840 [Deltaproteobacteria bacterium RIFOXYA12_FULL_58_15]
MDGFTNDRDTHGVDLLCHVGKFTVGKFSIVQRQRLKPSVFLIASVLPCLLGFLAGSSACAMATLVTRATK